MRLLIFLAGFILYSSSFQARLLSRITNHRLASHVANAVESEVDEKEIIKFFSRLADDYLLLDIPDAGTPGMMNCCHGGCDNCAYSHIFDNLSAGRPKWVPIYASRQLIDGRSHTSPWGRLFRDDPNSTEPFQDLRGRQLKWAELATRLRTLPSRSCLGTPSNAPSDEMLNDAVLRILKRAVLQSDTSDDATVTTDEFAAALARITKEEHGAPWRSFSDGFKQMVAN